MKVGDRVRVKDWFRHSHFQALNGVMGTISLIGEPFPGDPKNEPRYEVTFDEPLAPRGWHSFFPFREEMLEIL